MSNPTLPSNIQKQIDDKANEYFINNNDEISLHPVNAYIAGATESPYKQKYEKLLAEYESCFKDVLRSHGGFTDEEIQQHWEKTVKLF